MPRNFERFQEYLKMLTGGTDDIVLPIAQLNPMGKEHVGAYVDKLIALGVEETAQQALDEATPRLAHVDASLKVALVVADDAAGGWTNRYLTDSSHRLEASAEATRGFATVLFWTSEEPSARHVCTEVLAAVYRNLHILKHGQPKTLHEVLLQEGRAAIFADDERCLLEAAEKAGVEKIMMEHLESDHFPIIFACMYGDEAAEAVGYNALGLPKNAGFAFAKQFANRSSERVESVL